MYLLLIIITWLISDVLSDEQLYTNADYIDIDSILSNEDHLERRQLIGQMTDIENMNKAPQNCIGLLQSNCSDGNPGWADYRGTGCIFHSTAEFIYIITAAHNLWMRDVKIPADRFCHNHRFYWKVQNEAELAKLIKNGDGRVLAGNDLQRAWVAEQYTNLDIKSITTQSQHDWGVLKYRNTLGVTPPHSTLKVATPSVPGQHSVKLDLRTIEVNGKQFHAKEMDEIDFKSIGLNRLYKRPGTDFFVIPGMSGSPLFNTGTQEQVAIVARGGSRTKPVYMTCITQSKYTIINQIVAGEWNADDHTHPANRDNPKLAYTNIPPQAQSAQIEYMDYMDDGNGYYHRMNPLLLTLWLVLMMLLIFICCILESAVVGFCSLCCYYQYNKAKLPQQDIDIESV